MDTAIATTRQPSVRKFENVRAVDVRHEYCHGSGGCPMSALRL